MKCRDRKTHVSWRHYHPEMFCTFRMIWKLSGWSGNFPDGLETFRMIWKWSGNVLYFPDDLKTFWMIWKLSGWFGNFPDDKVFQKRIYVNVAKTIYPLFWCICRENNLRAPSRKFLRVKGLFTYYVSRRRGGRGYGKCKCKCKCKCLPKKI